MEYIALNALKTIWYVLTLQCEEADRIRAMARTGHPTRAQRIAEALHRLSCGACRAARRQLEILDALLDHASTRHDDASAALPDKARTRLRQRLHQQMEKGD